MIKDKDFEAGFFAVLGEAPPMPDCYPGVMRRIRQRTRMARMAWAVAASILVAAGSFMYVEQVKKIQVPTEVAEELQSIHSHITGDDVRQELVSCSLMDEEMY